MPLLNIDDCALPMIGILLGRPGSGKTVPITMLSKWVYGDNGDGDGNGNGDDDDNGDSFFDRAYFGEWRT
jgi:ABC-type multidrug transport system ATPase subunit